ncbi:hypothetical protein CRN39_05140 [Vibrio vulnificus]|nr:hypothetical protein CRN39_05140 [Vibrio vulnificus]
MFNSQFMRSVHLRASNLTCFCPKPSSPHLNPPLMVIKSIKTTDMVMEVAAFRAGVFVLFVFIPQINLGVDKPLHQIAVELPFSSVDSPADVICEGDAKEN